MSERDFERLARRIRPDEDISNRRSLREIVSSDAGVKPKAIPTDVLTSGIYFWVSGAITAGPSIAQQFEMPTRGRIRSVRVRLKTATGAVQQISLMADGAPIVVVALPLGATVGGEVASEVVAAGALLEIKASANTGGNASITVRYEPDSE